MLEAILNRKSPANISPISILAFLENVLNSLWELVFQAEFISTTTTTTTTTTTESTTQTTSKPTVTTVTTSTTSTTVLTTAPITVTSTTTASSSTTTTTTQSTSTTSPLPRLQNATGKGYYIRPGSYSRIICLPSDCGVKGGGETKIIGGQDANENEYPWHCSVLNKDDSVR